MPLDRAVILFDRPVIGGDGLPVSGFLPAEIPIRGVVDGIGPITCVVAREVVQRLCRVGSRPTWRHLETVRTAATRPRRRLWHVVGIALPDRRFFEFLAGGRSSGLTSHGTTTFAGRTERGTFTATITPKNNTTAVVPRVVAPKSKTYRAA